MNLKHLGCASLLALCFYIPQINAAEPPKEAAPKWDYRIVQEAQLFKEGGIVFEKDAPAPTPDQVLKNQETALKKLGDAGWELTSVVRIDKHDAMKTIYHLFYFKKPKPADAPETPKTDSKK